MPPETPEETPHPVRVTFAATKATYLVKAVIASIDLELDFYNETECGFTVDVSLLQRRLHELAYAESSCYNLERWYETLQDHTAETFTISLSDEDLEVLRKLHAAWHLGNHSVENAVLERHAALERRVQQAVWGDRQDTFFVKTSMRSPKDAVDVEHASDDSAHTRLQREIAACCVTDAAAAISLLIGSKRVMTDIANYLKYRTQASLPLNLILRRWEASIAESTEWRCYISDGRLTCVSQYHCYTTLPPIVGGSTDEVLQRLRCVRERICAFQGAVHAQIVGCIGTCSYVLDVATEASAAVSSQVRLVEINPLHASGAALFSWTRDRRLLLSGREDGLVELRVVKQLMR
jgi:hypothetical protein